MKRILSIIIIGFLAVSPVSPSSLAFAQGGEESSSDEKKEVEEKEQKKAPDRYFNGVFFGSLIFIHPERISIVVEPFTKKVGRRTFYLDKRTKYRVDGRRASRDEVFEGDRVAIRYIAKNRFAMAEVIFVETDEFLEPKKYMAKVRARKKKKKKKKEGEEESGSKDEKKSGGH